jgi:NAD(P) transhydrogenase
MSPAYDFDLICIGSGPAGQRAAVQASKLGRRAAVVEKRRCVGGACIDTGTIPSKTLREAVVTFSGLAGKGDRLPWARLESRPTCQQLFAGVDSVIAREVEVIESQLRRNDVSVLPGVASFVDPHTLAIETDSGRHLYHRGRRRSDPSLSRRGRGALAGDTPAASRGCFYEIAC